MRYFKAFYKIFVPNHSKCLEIKEKTSIPERLCDLAGLVVQFPNSLPKTVNVGTFCEWVEDLLYQELNFFPVE